MGNGKSNEAERQELSGPGTSFNGKYIVPANSCLKPVTVNTKQFALYFTDWLVARLKRLKSCMLIRKSSFQPFFKLWISFFANTKPFNF
jgi:hypothetical protein